MAQCPLCNRHKGSLTAARDPKTGQIVPLFDPRRDSWGEHFRWSSTGVHVIGLTQKGRATLAALKMNHELWLSCRRYWVLLGIWPPKPPRKESREAT